MTHALYAQKSWGSSFAQLPLSSLSFSPIPLERPYSLILLPFIWGFSTDVKCYLTFRSFNIFFKFLSINRVSLSVMISWGIPYMDKTLFLKSYSMLAAGILANAYASTTLSNNQLLKSRISIGPNLKVKDRRGQYPIVRKAMAMSTHAVRRGDIVKILMLLSLLTILHIIIGLLNHGG